MSLQKNKYTEILQQLKDSIRKAQVKAVVSANVHLLSAYWEIGKAIIEQQEEEGWGSKIIDRLAVDLRSEFSEMRGFSSRNLKYMRAFAEAYPDFAIMQVPPAQIEVSEKQSIAIVQGMPAQLKATIQYNDFAKLSWYHHTTLLDKLRDTETRVFYIEETIQNGWSRDVMVRQLESELHKRKGKAITNFSETLPAYQSDLAQQTFKSPYIFDFLTIAEKVKETDLEKAMIQHLKKFMLELGKGFAYVGNQKNIVVNGDDFFLDLLFYNYNLHCFVIFELKIGDFKPEFAGKLNFYVNTVNKQLKGLDDKPTIGVLLCKTPNETVIQYSLQGITSPIGVADYQLANALPATLKGDIPTVEELEEEIEKEYKELKKPYEKKLDQVKSLLRSLNQPQLKETRNVENVRKIFFKVALPILEEMKKALHTITTEFEAIEYRVYIEGSGYTNIEDALKWFEDSNTAIPYGYRITIELKGCKTAGIKAFNVWKDLYIENSTYFYKVCFDQHRQEDSILEKLYHELPAADEIDKVIEKYTEAIAEDIQRNVERIRREMNNE